MSNKFETFEAELDSPAESAFAVTPDDNSDLPEVVRGIYVGVAGDMAAILAKDTVAVTFINLEVGFHPMRVKRVLSTGTTASSIVGLL